MVKFSRFPSSPRRKVGPLRMIALLLLCGFVVVLVSQWLQSDTYLWGYYYDSLLQSNPYVFTSASCATFKSTLGAGVPGDKKVANANVTNGGHSFTLKVYDKDDIVSQMILRGDWENYKVRAFNKFYQDYVEQTKEPMSSLSFVDIGANVGWFSFNMAALGINVVAVEPMQENIDLMKESMCLPENLQSGISDRITLYGHGLGVTDETCIIYSDDKNKGDGHVACVKDESEFKLPDGYSILGRIPVRRLDDVISTHGRHVVIFKMDTEGFEGNVLEGGTKFMLNGGIDLVVTEFIPEWIQEKGADPNKFMKRFYDAGYRAMKEDESGFMNKQDMSTMSNFHDGFDVVLHSPRYRSRFSAGKKKLFGLLGSD